MNVNTPIFTLELYSKPAVQLSGELLKQLELVLKHESVLSGVSVFGHFYLKLMNQRKAEASYSVTNLSSVT